MSVIRKKPSKPRGTGAPLRSASRSARRGGVHRGRNGPLNRETLSDRPAPLTVPQRTTNHPEQPVERGEQNGEVSPEDSNARVDGEPLHHETHGTSASVTTTRKPAPGAHTARAVERTGKRNTVTKRHFQSNPSSRVGWYIVVSHCHTVSYEVNAFLLQYALNRLNILLILAGNTNVTLDLAVTVLNNFKLKRDTIQTENDVPAR